MRRQVEDEALGHDIALQVEDLTRSEVRSNAGLGTDDMGSSRRRTLGFQYKVRLWTRFHDMMPPKCAVRTAYGQKVACLA